MDHSNAKGVNRWLKDRDRQTLAKGLKATSLPVSSFASGPPAV
jgi:hypothetical protein